ncbi:MAG: 5-formyltetrahydrofolate cyclo-ligase [Deltaproteobacteria bacterium]|nr:MAG: 5-formyltetrahydrofolate cyclo-ligase [Deltaproteobacteria bacterium]
MSRATTIAAEKHRVREAMRVRRRGLSEAAVQEASAAACRRLAALPEWERSGTIALYAGHAGELDPRCSVAAGRRFVFPALAPAGRCLDFFEVSDPAQLLPGRYGIDAPDPRRHPPCPVAAIDLFVVPGLAFDRRGRRLGRGGGYYDATLSAARLDAVRVGLAWDFQLLPELPWESHDQGLDLLVTPSVVLRFAREPAT